MQNIPTKTDGVSTLPAAEFNQIPSELENLITDTGQTLSAGDLFQASKAASIYAAGGDFYTDSGAADAYVLSVVGSKQAPDAYFTGMKVRFETPNATTGGAATINVAGLGVKNIKQFDGTTDPAAGSIPANAETTLSYDGTNFVITSIASVAGNSGAGTGSVTNVATGEGLTGGPITTTGTASLDVNGLIENAAVDLANDFLVFYDASLAGHRKIKPDDLIGSGNQSLGASGYKTFPGGLTIQWAKPAAFNTSTAVVFPIAFTTAVYAITFGGVNSTSGYSNFPSADSVTTSGFTMYSGTVSSTEHYYFAIGQ